MRPQRRSQSSQRSQSSHRSQSTQRSQTSQRSQSPHGSQSTQRSQARPSTSSSSSVADTPSHIRSSLLENCVQAILVLHQNKLPVKKSELSKLVFRQNGKMFKSIMEECAIIFKDVYGFRLLEVTDKNQYILVNNIDLSDAKFVERNTDENVERGILIAVLAVIFMSDGELKQDKMYQFLERLGFDMDSKSPLEYLNCSIVELLTQRWVRQLYLKYEKVEYSEPTEYVFRWGFRAENELNKTEVLKFVCDIWGDKVTPEKWKKQWAVAHARTESQNGFTQ